MIIYKVTNLITNKCYIGKTIKTLNERKKSHLKNIRNNVQSKFYNSVRKYGKDNFIWEILIECEKISLLNELECFFIEKYNSFNNGYNMTLGGDGGDTISHKSDFEKKNQGAKIGNIPWNKGLVMKEIGYTFDGRKSRSPFTDEQKLEHSKKIKNSEKYHKGLENRKHGKSKSVIRITDQKEWNTIKDCSIDLKIKKETLRYRILNKIPINDVIYSFKY